MTTPGGDEGRREVLPRAAPEAQERLSDRSHRGG